MPAQERYKSLLDHKRPEDHPISPCLDVDWWVQQVEDGSVTESEFPGLYVRKIDMAEYNQTEDVKRNPGKYRQLALYCLRGSPEEEEHTATSQNNNNNKHELIKQKDQCGEYDNLYACAHLYACDKNSLFLAARALGHQNFSALASLSITVIFHQHGEALRMVDWDTVSSASSEQTGGSLPKKWFIQEAWSPRSGDNRVAHESWLWSPDGTLLATTLQDGQFRLNDLGAKL